MDSLGILSVGSVTGENFGNVSAYEGASATVGDLVGYEASNFGCHSGGSAN